MNWDLFEHGIEQEDSDIRAHVGVIARSIFVFQTKEWPRIRDEFDPPFRDAYQPDIEGRTAEGRLVRLQWFKDLKTIKVNEGWPLWKGWTKYGLNPSEKGRRAVETVLEAIKRGKFPIWADHVRNDERTNVQIKGTDIVIYARRKIQVKCDFDAGPKDIEGCTGNLFIQTKERNPLKRH